MHHVRYVLYQQPEGGHHQIEPMDHLGGKAVGYIAVGYIAVGYVVGCIEGGAADEGKVFECCRVAIMHRYNVLY
jgi:hypothetical protein